MMTISGQLLQSLKTVTVSASAVVERKLNIIQMERMDDSLYGLDCATVLQEQRALHWVKSAQRTIIAAVQADEPDHRTK
jgi:hypothetical protein